MTRKHGNINVSMHFLLGVLTGGLWWIWLFLKYILNGRD